MTNFLFLYVPFIITGYIEDLNLTSNKTACTNATSASNVWQATSQPTYISHYYILQKKNQCKYGYLMIQQQPLLYLNTGPFIITDIQDSKTHIIRDTPRICL